MADITIDNTITSAIATPLGFPQFQPVKAKATPVNQIKSRRRFNLITAATAAPRGSLDAAIHLVKTTGAIASSTGSVHGVSGFNSVTNAVAKPVNSPRNVVRLEKNTTATATPIGTIHKPNRFRSPTVATSSESGTIRAHQLRITGITRALATVDGDIKARTTSFSLPEDRASVLGYRPFTSLLVYGVNINSSSDVAESNVPNGGSYLMSPSFLQSTDSTLWGFGARANYVGTLVNGNNFFRPPTRKEIVWLIDVDAQARTAPDEFYIFDGTVWKVFQPFGYRALAGQLQYVASQLDPSGALLYYGKILGAIGAELGQDNLDLAAITDPDSTPQRYLPIIADELGVDISGTDSVPEMRRRIRAAVTLHRNKGTIQSSVAAIREAGFSGYVREIMVNPTAETNWFAVTDAPLTIQAYINEHGLENIINADSGLKGQDILERPHNYDNVDPVTYFLSSRVAVHVNNLDGTPVQTTTPDVLNNLFATLRTYCLPAHVDIRYFITDLSAPTRNGAQSGEGEIIKVIDSVTITPTETHPDPTGLTVDFSGDDGEEFFSSFAWVGDELHSIPFTDESSVVCRFTTDGTTWTLTEEVVIDGGADNNVFNTYTSPVTGPLPPAGASEFPDNTGVWFRVGSTSSAVIVAY